MGLKSLVLKAKLAAQTLVHERQNKKLLDAILALPDAQGGLTLIDIGAAGNLEPRWKKIAAALNYVGFEPDPRSITELQEKQNGCRSFKIYQHALGESDGEISFNLCRKPMASSSFIPNRAFVDRFPDATRFDISRTEKMNTTTLDALNVPSPDFIKLDIQGAELNALKGARQTLKNTIGLEIEVEFLPMYEKQPLFGDISKFLEDFDFEFVDFVSLYRWERAEINNYGQCVFGDALFLATPEKIVARNEADNTVLPKYLTLCLLYRRFDLMDRALSLLSQPARSRFAAFEAALSPLRKRHHTVRKITEKLNSLIRWADSEYRAHLIH